MIDRLSWIRDISFKSCAKPKNQKPWLDSFQFGLASYESQRYFWTGGIISGGAISWPNGITQSVYELGDLFSHTGG
jgi:hypothetical protein